MKATAVITTSKGIDREGDEIKKVNHRILLKNFMQIMREGARMTTKTLA